MPDSSSTAEARRRFDLPAYDDIALVLQGGGALGSYQAGIYQGLAESGIAPTWIAGISIGAFNTAIIAGNPPEKRVAALRGFWDAITTTDDTLALWGAQMLRGLGFDRAARGFASGWSAMRAVMLGQSAFFAPRTLAPLASYSATAPDTVSWYETRSMEETLAAFTDFDRINDGDMRVSVGAVNVRDGELVYFDNRRTRLEPKHILASGALPPGFPAIEIDGEYYWDGGTVSNTPLVHVLGESLERDVLVFEVDLWDARGPLPASFAEVEERLKSLQYSSRSKLVNALMAERRKRLTIAKRVLDSLPADLAESSAEVQALREEVDKAGLANVVQLIYRNKFFEKYYKDIEFSRDTMNEHWESGLEDMRASLAHTDWFCRPDFEIGMAVHNVHAADAGVQAVL